MNVTGKARVSKVLRREDRYTLVSLGWSRKGRGEQEEDWVWSNMLATLVGDAHLSFTGLDVGDKIELTQARLDNEPYDGGDGVRVWNNPKILVFEFELQGESGGHSTPSSKSLLADDDDIPF